MANQLAIPNSWISECFCQFYRQSADETQSTLHESTSDGPDQLANTGYKSTPSPTLCSANSLVATSLESRLPQLAEDTEVVNEAKRINEIISQHTKNYYPVDKTGCDEDAPSDFIWRTIAAPETRRNSIRRYIGQRILDHIKCDGEYPSILPRRAVEFKSKFPSAEPENDGKTIKLMLTTYMYDRLISDNQGYVEELSKLRHLPIRLQSDSSDKLPVEDLPASKIVEEQSDALYRDLSRYASDDQARIQNLVQLVRHAAILGMLLFLDEKWEFGPWDSNEQDGGKLVVFPSLLKDKRIVLEEIVGAGTSTG
jgi:hypothetical protein